MTFIVLLFILFIISLSVLCAATVAIVTEVRSYQRALKPYRELFDL